MERSEKYRWGSNICDIAWTPQMRDNPASKLEQREGLIIVGSRSQKGSLSRL